jgi:hypothetical protein
VSRAIEAKEFIPLKPVQTMIAAVIFYNGSEAEGREHFKWLYDLGKQVLSHSSLLPHLL